jgi:hypothetical protein
MSAGDLEGPTLRALRRVEARLPPLEALDDEYRRLAEIVDQVLAQHLVDDPIAQALLSSPIIRRYCFGIAVQRLLPPSTLGEGGYSVAEPLRAAPAPAGRGPEESVPDVSGAAGSSGEAATEKSNPERTEPEESAPEEGTAPKTGGKTGKKGRDR